MEPTKTSEPPMEHLQPNVLVVVLRLLAALFLLDTTYALLLFGFFALNDVHEWHSSYIALMILVLAIKYGITAVFTTKLFADWAGRAYYLSGHHLFERLGLVNITETTYELSQVKSVIVHQSWLGRRFNYGTIKLSFAGSDKQQEIMLRDVNNPMKYKRYFDDHLQVQGWVR